MKQVLDRERIANLARAHLENALHSVDHHIEIAALNSAVQAASLLAEYYYAGPGWIRHSVGLDGVADLVEGVAMTS